MNINLTEITWIIRVTSLQSDSTNIIRLIGPPNVILESDERLVHVYENINDNKSVCEMCGTLTSQLEKVMLVKQNLSCDVVVNVRVDAAGEDFFMELPWELISLLNRLGSKLELYFVSQ